MTEPIFSRSRHLKRPGVPRNDNKGHGLPSSIGFWRGLVAIVVGIFVLFLPLEKSPDSMSGPREEPIVRTRGAHHVFSTGERVSLVDFLAAEVRRARKRENRLASHPILDLTEVEMRRVREKARQAAEQDARLVESDIAGTSTNNVWSLEPGYWRGKDDVYEAALSIERSTLNLPVMNRILVATKSRTIFCPIPGVADKMIIQFLENAEQIRPGSLRSLASFSIRDRERFLTSGDIFRFVFVRHPFVRVAQAYTNGVEGRELESPEYRDFMGRVRGRTLTESEHELQKLSILFFLTFLGRQKPAELDTQFLPQVDICAIDGKINYDMVFRHENLREDIAKMAETLGVDTSKMRIPGKTGEAVSQDGPFFDSAMAMFSNSKHRAKVTKLYSADLTKLEYSPTHAPTIVNE